MQEKLEKIISYHVNGRLRRLPRPCRRDRRTRRKMTSEARRLCSEIETIVNIGLNLSQLVKIGVNLSKLVYASSIHN